MAGNRKSTPDKTQQRRGSVKHIQQTRVSDGEGREEQSSRGKAQKIAEKKEARPNVEKRKMQKKGGAKRRGSQ